MRKTSEKAKSIFYNPTFYLSLSFVIWLLINNLYLSPLAHSIGKSGGLFFLTITNCGLNVLVFFFASVIVVLCATEFISKLFDSLNVNIESFVQNALQNKEKYKRAYVKNVIFEF